MLYEKDKLEQYFRDEISRVSELEIKDLDEEIEIIRTQTLSEMEANAKHDVDIACEQELRELQSEYATRQSRLHDETDRRLMRKRNELAEMIFSDVIKKIEEFTQSKEYEDLLRSRAKELSQYNYPNSCIYIREADKKYANAIKSEFTDSIKIECDDEIRFGGLRLESIESGIVVDETFDSLLNEQKEWFYHNSGLFVK